MRAKRKVGRWTRLAALTAIVWAIPFTGCPPWDAGLGVVWGVTEPIRAIGLIFRTIDTVNQAMSSDIGTLLSGGLGGGGGGGGPQPPGGG